MSRRETNKPRALKLTKQCTALVKWPHNYIAVSVSNLFRFCFFGWLPHRPSIPNIYPNIPPQHQQHTHHIRICVLCVVWMGGWMLRMDLWARIELWVVMKKANHIGLGTGAGEGSASRVFAKTSSDAQGFRQKYTTHPNIQNGMKHERTNTKPNECEIFRRT